MERAAFSFFFFFFFLLLLFATLPCCWEPAAAAASSGRWTTAACNGTAGGGHGCRVEEDDAEEFQLDSESNRRLLAQGHASGALDPNKPVCYTKNGKPYNCANPRNPGGGPTCQQDYYRCDQPPSH